MRRLCISGFDDGCRRCGGAMEPERLDGLPMTVTATIAESLSTTAEDEGNEKV